jgi:hypothetical protein
MRLEYKIDSSNSLLFIPSLNFRNNNTVSTGNSSAYYGPGDSSNTSDNRTSTQRSGYTLRNTLLYRHSFAKRGRTFSVNFNTTFN